MAAKFGSTLLRKGLQQFDGAVEIRFEPSGRRCRLSLSLPFPREREAIDLEANRPPAAILSAPIAHTAATEPKLVLHPPHVAGRK